MEADKRVDLSESSDYSCHVQQIGSSKVTRLRADGADLHEALSDLVRAYQFRDRDSICCHNISVTQCYALEALQSNGPMRLNDLAERLFLDKSTSSRVLAALVRKGYVERLLDLTDRRAISVRTTTKGRALYRRIHDELVDQQAEMIADLTTEERQSAIKVIGRLARAAEKKFGIGGAVSSRSTCCGQ